jgi:hypothetical protein
MLALPLALLKTKKMTYPQTNGMQMARRYSKADCKSTNCLISEFGYIERELEETGRDE